MPKDVLECLQMTQQELLDWVIGELQRVEQDIKNQEEELKVAKTDQDSVVIQKRIDRLCQKEREMRQDLVTMHAQLASPAGKVLATAPR